MSTVLPFERVKRINQSVKDCVFGFIREAQCLWETENAYYQTPESIQIIILLFYYNIIKSSLLTPQECDKLLSMFEEQNKFQDLGNYEYNLIYRCSVDGFNEKKFKTQVHNKPNVLILIKTKQRDNIFGGYTHTGWTGDAYKLKGIQDDKAFIFSIRNSNNYPLRIFNGIKGRETLRTQNRYYCMFGYDCTIWIYDQTNCGAARDTGKDFEARPKEEFPHYFGTGDFGSFAAEDVEVFQLK